MATNATPVCDISVAITGYDGAGSITAGELLLGMAGNGGCFGMMRLSFGPQIRSGEALAPVRIAHQPAADEIPAEVRELGVDIVEVPMKAHAPEVSKPAVRSWWRWAFLLTRLDARSIKSCLAAIPYQGGLLAPIRPC